MTEPVQQWLVPVADVARRAGLNAADPGVAEAVELAISDATVDAETYLGRPVLPVTLTERGLRPGADGAWPLPVEPVVRVESVTAETDGNGRPTGLYTVTYLAGLDARLPELAPIRRWVAAAAAYAHPAVRRLAGSGGREVRSVSADGQAVTYTDGPSAADVPTVGVPPLSTLDRWRIAGRRAYTRPGWADQSRSGQGTWRRWP